jgi:hypothetical protein
LNILSNISDFFGLKPHFHGRIKPIKLVSFVSFLPVTCRSEVVIEVDNP